MAKNVNDRGLIEDTYRAIERRAGTNAGNMARRIMEERSDRWEDGDHVDGGGRRVVGRRCRGVLGLCVIIVIVVVCLCIISC